MYPAYYPQVAHPAVLPPNAEGTASMARVPDTLFSAARAHVDAMDNILPPPMTWPQPPPANDMGTAPQSAWPADSGHGRRYSMAIPSPGLASKLFNGAGGQICNFVEDGPPTPALKLEPAGDLFDDDDDTGSTSAGGSETSDCPKIEHHYLGIDTAHRGWRGSEAWVGGVLSLGLAPSPGLGPEHVYDPPPELEAKISQVRGCCAFAPGLEPKRDIDPPPGLEPKVAELGGWNPDANCTTVMLQRLPYELDEWDLSRLLDRLGFSGRYDAVAVPRSHRRGESLGYAFVNFGEPAMAAACIAACGGCRFGGSSSDRVCIATYSRKQGAAFIHECLKTVPSTLASGSGGRRARGGRRTGRV